MTNKICEVCQKPFQVPVWRTKTAKYCSVPCRRIGIRNKRSVLYKGIIYCPNKKGYYENAPTGKKLHREIYQDFYDVIPDKFIVHHKNHNPSDNRLGNLQVFPSQSHHVAYHNRARALNTEQIREIRNNKGKHRIMAEKFERCVSTIANIKHRRTYEYIK